MEQQNSMQPQMNMQGQENGQYVPGYDTQSNMHLCGTLYGSFVQQLSKYCVVAFCCDYNWLLYVSENSFVQNESERISCQTNEPVLYDWDAWSGHLYGKYRKRMDLDVK